jgi:sulfur-carrier protein
VNVKVCYFGKVAERMGTRGFDLEGEIGPRSLWALRADLFAGIEDWANPVAAGLMMSVNQSLMRADTPLKDGDEVAFFSPFSGG